MNETGYSIYFEDDYYNDKFDRDKFEYEEAVTILKKIIDDNSDKKTVVVLVQYPKMLDKK